KQYDQYRFNLAVAYGGREEILRAIRDVVQDARAGKVVPDDIDEKFFSKRLYTADLPDPDLVLRTSGEERISNFLIWQLAYSELYFVDVYWPGFRKIDFLRALRSYQMRQRRYGE
ncbi:MAG TPA: polyprenyl diphosphate synthase, partial [Thermoplasmata archaeon]|nr:polyprenyl diphosphate synthase [Thermoplasmata archaeon]